MTWPDTKARERERKVLSDEKRERERGRETKGERETAAHERPSKRRSAIELVKGLGNEAQHFI